MLVLVSLLSVTLNGKTINGVSYKDDYDIDFYSNGQVEYGYLNGDQTIDDVIYTYGYIYFYENGQVKQGLLNNNPTIDGVSYEYSYWIRFNEDATVHNSSSNYNSNF